MLKLNATPREPFWFDILPGARMRLGAVNDILVDLLPEIEPTVIRAYQDAAGDDGSGQSPVRSRILLPIADCRSPTAACIAPADRQSP